MSLSRVKIEGTDAQIERLAKLRRQAPMAFAAAVYVAASSIVSTAMRLTPVDTGWLRSSRYVTKPRARGTAFEVTMGFSATYAPFVHNIKRNYVVGEWRFLDTAVRYHAPTVMNEVARMTAGFIASGKGPDDVPPLHPVKPMDKTNRAALEGLASLYRRRRSAATRAKRAAAAPRNQDRIARESASSLDAQRSGRRGPRPGRG